MNNTNIPKLLAPAGDFERLEAAIRFGADEVYLGGSLFGLRAAAANFEGKKLKQAVAYAHKHGVRVFLTCNSVPTNSEMEQLPEFLKSAQDAGVDALIIADMGVFAEARCYAPNVEVHISTQAGIVNYVSANELHRMGAKRVVLARELSLDDIRIIRENTPEELELEVFVHGAMCMSFSGRCLLSHYLTGRDANRGECAQPCRWGYHLVEEKRPGLYFPIFEDERGSYIMNAKDLCLIEHIDKLAKAGVSSIKIEGRAKSSYYVSVITNAYRNALDQYANNPNHFTLEPWILDEVTKVSHRHYNTGFLFGQPEDSQYYENGGYLRNFDVVAIVDFTDGEFIHATQRNKFLSGDTVEILQPGQKPFSLEVTEIIDDNGDKIDSACHAMMKFRIPYYGQLPKGSIIRKENK